MNRSTLLVAAVLLGASLPHCAPGADEGSGGNPGSEAATAGRGVLVVDGEPTAAAAQFTHASWAITARDGTNTFFPDQDSIETGAGIRNNLPNGGPILSDRVGYAYLGQLIDVSYGPGAGSNPGRPHRLGVFRDGAASEPSYIAQSWDQASAPALTQVGEVDLAPDGSATVQLREAGRFAFVCLDCFEQAGTGSRATPSYPYATVVVEDHLRECDGDACTPDLLH